MEEKAALNRRLLVAAMRQKAIKWRQRQIKEVFDRENGEVREQIKKKIKWAKRTGKIGLHPFLISGDYKEREDKIVAILMSALIPVEEDKVLKRVSVLRELLGGSPRAFVEGAYKIKDYDRYKTGLGCSKWALQGWTEIVKGVMDGPEEMMVNNLDYYIMEREFGLTDEIKESKAEAVFWLEEKILGTPKKEIKIPLTRAVKRLIRTEIPRYRMLGWEGAVKMLDLDYDAEIWWAACAVCGARFRTTNSMVKGE